MWYQKPTAMKKQVIVKISRTTTLFVLKKVPNLFFFFKKLLSAFFFSSLLLASCQKASEVYLSKLNHFVEETRSKSLGFTKDRDWDVYDNELQVFKTEHKTLISQMSLEEKERASSLFHEYTEIRGAYYGRRIQEKLNLIKSSIRELLNPDTEPTNL